MARHCIDSPFGPLTLIERDGVLAALEFGGDADGAPPATPLLLRAAEQLADYAAGRRTRFDLPLAPAPSAFQRRVRAAMLAIPFGETRSYGALAETAGGTPRAIGQACGRNPIPIIVPCHRVVAAGGRLGGFSGGDGLPTKRRLLAHEAAPDPFAAARKSPESPPFLR